jgi:hypothetical protein
VCLLPLFRIHAHHFGIQIRGLGLSQFFLSASRADQRLRRQRAIPAGFLRGL